jgi:signal peptidase II
VITTLAAIYRIPAVLVVGLVALDQWTKVWAVKTLAVAGPYVFQTRGGGTVEWANRPSNTIDIFSSWFAFRYAENRAAAFSLTESIPFAWRMPLLIGISVAAVGGVIWYLYKLGPAARLSQVALGLILGGAIGNLIDRVWLGYVVDFIDWHWAGQWHFPTFNVADSAIVVGGAILILFAGREGVAVKKESAEPKEDLLDPLL